MPLAGTGACDCGACEDDELAELAEAAAQAWLDEGSGGDAPGT
jgi:hypothetical protein